jgi:hypothetical protein
MGPMLAALTLLGDRMRGAWEAPTAFNILLLCLAVVVWFVIAFGLQLISNRLASNR